MGGLGYSFAPIYNNVAFVVDIYIKNKKTLDHDIYKTKIQPSTTPGKEGSIVFQLIYGRTVRRITSEYKIFAEEWDDELGG